MKINILKKIKQKKEFHQKNLFYLAFLLLFIVLINEYIHIKTWDDWPEILWYCNFAAIFLAFSIFLKNKVLINSVLISALPAQFLWIVDFFLNLFGTGLGRTDWLFTDSNLVIFIISTILHGILIPISFYGTLIYGYSKKAYKYSILIFSVILLIFSHIPAKGTYENYNCVFYPCDYNLNDNGKEIFNNGFYLSWYYVFYQIIYWSILIYIINLTLIFIFSKFKITKISN